MGLSHAPHLRSALWFRVHALGVARALSRWLDQIQPRTLPWLRADSRWQVVSAEMLLEGAGDDLVRHLWPLIRRWTTPAETITAAAELEQIAAWVGRAERAGRLLRAARAMHHDPPLSDTTLESAVTSKLVPPSTSALARLVVPVTGEDWEGEPVLVRQGVLRVAWRFVAEAQQKRNQVTDGRIAVARMIGMGDNSRAAHVAMMELAATVCRPALPDCTRCPLARWCASDRTAEIALSQLPLEDPSPDAK